MNQENTITAAASRDSASQAWLRALERTASIPKNPTRLLSHVVEMTAQRVGDRPALVSDRQSLSYAEVTARANQYARWARHVGVVKGDTVALLMPNRPEYFCIWLGITSVGGVVALLNTNLTGASLAHCIRVTAPGHLIVAGECVEALNTALPLMASAPKIWRHGDGNQEYPDAGAEAARESGEPLAAHERPAVTIADRALCIFTSGTTGLPKAANVSHARVLQWSHWFAGMMDVTPGDRLYNCLPMYHSVGGVQAVGAMLAGGGSVAIREKFSASQFWSDVRRWDCSLVQYIGELCRYLLAGEPSQDESDHRVRMACGNGLAPELWDRFRERFRIPRIFEFYAATEGGVSLFNIEGRRGSIGRVPGYLLHRFSPVLVRFDVETGEPARNEDGFCIRCGPNETGEALGRMGNDTSNPGSRFEGYTDPAATERRILRDVFESGDAWARTGDLMRRDEKGFFYFVERVGDTFRRKGENVATSEVSEAICAFPGIRQANVYGVAVPQTDGRVGMAAVVVDGTMDLAGLRRHLADRLPAYARPVFVRMRESMDLTETFKYAKSELVRQGYDPAATADAIFFDHPETQAFVRLDQALYERIQSGEQRL